MEGDRGFSLLFFPSYLSSSYVCYYPSPPSAPTAVSRQRSRVCLLLPSSPTSARLSCRPLYHADSTNPSIMERVQVSPSFQETSREIPFLTYRPGFFLSPERVKLFFPQPNQHQYGRFLWMGKQITLPDLINRRFHMSSPFSLSGDGHPEPAPRQNLPPPTPIVDRVFPSRLADHLHAFIGYVIPLLFPSPFPLREDDDGPSPPVRIPPKSLGAFFFPWRVVEVR